MKTYTILRNLYGSLTKNTSTENLTLGDQLINDEHRHLCSLRDFEFLHRARTLTTTASTQFYALPYDVEQVDSISVVVDDQTYTPRPVRTREEWDRLNSSTVTSDSVERYCVFNGQVGLYPIPATSSNTITVSGKIRPIDMNTADITSSTITTLANGGTALTVSGGLTTQMGGFWIRPTFSTTANTGDGQWYELSSVTNSTTAVLVRKYGGASIAVGTAPCTIAQVPLLPEAFHDLPVYLAAATYWDKEGDIKRATSYRNKYERDKIVLMTRYGSFLTSPVLDDGEGDEMINPNLTISL